MQTVQKGDLSFIQTYKSKVKTDGRIYGALINFLVIFDNAHFSKKLSNSCFAEKINFSQCFLYFKNSFAVKKGNIISGSFALMLNKNKPSKTHIKISASTNSAKKQVQSFVVE